MCKHKRGGRILYTQNGIKFESTEIRVTDRKKDRLGGEICFILTENACYTATQKII